MSLPKLVPLLATTLSGAWLITGNVYADQPQAENLTSSPVLQASVKNEEFLDGANGRQVQRVYLTSGTNQFAFTVPEGFRVDASNPQKIVLSDINCTCFIICRFASPSPVSAGESQAGSFRNLASSRFPGARIADEFSDGAANHSGPAFDLQWKNSGGTEQTARVVFIPLAAGVMEFNLLASTRNFDSGRSVLKTVLASLRSNEGGKLQIIRLSDKS